MKPMELMHLHVLGVCYISAIFQLLLGDSVALHNTMHEYVFSFVLYFNIPSLGIAR
jgi:hypothetical protein